MPSEATGLPRLPHQSFAAHQLVVSSFGSLDVSCLILWTLTALTTAFIPFLCPCPFSSFIRSCGRRFHSFVLSVPRKSAHVRTIEGHTMYPSVSVLLLQGSFIFGASSKCSLGATACRRLSCGDTPRIVMGGGSRRWMGPSSYALDLWWGARSEQFPQATLDRWAPWGCVGTSSTTAGWAASSAGGSAPPTELQHCFAVAPRAHSACIISILVFTTAGQIDTAMVLPPQPHTDLLARGKARKTA